MERRRSFTNAPHFGLAPLQVVVGKDENEKVFYVHEEQATKFSGVIAAAVKGGFKEAEERTVRFPEDDPEAFAIFISFRYAEAIYCSKPDESRTGDVENSRLMAVWVLGERLQASELRDAAVDATIERMKATNTHATNLHKTVYANSIGPSGMRRLSIDIAIWSWTHETMKQAKRDEARNEFFADLAVKLHSLYGGQRSGLPYYSGGCLYHDHGSEKPCYRTMFSSWRCDVSEEAEKGVAASSERAQRWCHRMCVLGQGGNYNSDQSQTNQPPRRVCSVLELDFLPV